MILYDSQAESALVVSRNGACMVESCCVKGTHEVMPGSYRVEGPYLGYKYRFSVCELHMKLLTARVRMASVNLYLDHNHGWCTVHPDASVWEVKDGKVHVE